METITLTQAQFDAIPDPIQVMPDGYIFKKKFGDDYLWMQIVGNTTVEKLIISPESQALKRVAAGVKLKKEIWKALAPANDATKAGILNTIPAVLIAIGDGELSAARIIANATATNADYTAGRKATLIGLIDAAIAGL